MRGEILTGLVLLTGCASTTWYHPDYVSERSVARHFTIDNGRCQQAAAGAAPLPIPAGGPTQTYVHGTTFNRYGQPVGGYAGTAYAYPTGNAATGFANGLNIGNAVVASGARRDIYRGCMTQLGWTTDEHAAQMKASGYDSFGTRHVDD